MPADIDIDRSGPGAAPESPPGGPPPDIVNPFQIRPRMPDEFLGREAEVARIWSLVHGTGESVMIVSEMPNGRTSLLRYLEAKFIAAGRRTYFIDTLKLSPNITPEELMQRIHDRTGVDPTKSYGRKGARNAPIVLVDDVHILIGLKNIVHSAFFGALRLHAQIGCLGFIGTSEKSLLVMSQWLSGSTSASPVFNATLEVRLEVLGSHDTDCLLALAGEQFSAADRAFVTRLSGAQPKLLNLLGSALFTVGRLHPDLPAPARRRQALHVSRPDIGTVLHAIWQPLPPDERWCLVNISAGMRCGEAVPARDPQDSQVLTPSLEGARLGALVRFFHRLDRTTLIDVIREQLGPSAAAGLPGPSVSDSTMFSESAEFLRRCGHVRPILHAFARRDDVPQDELLRVMQLWEAYTPMTAVSESALDRLVDRGLVRPSLTPPCWEIRPSLLHWWLLDHLRDRRALESIVNAHSDEPDVVDCRAVHEFVEKHPHVFRPGALPLVEQEVG